MAVDHRLNLLGVDLQPADIDDSAPATEEVVAVLASFHDVAGVDEALMVHERRAVLVDIAEGGAGGTNPQRPVFDFHLHLAARADQSRRKALETVGDFESNASFRRSVPAADIGLRVECLERIEDRLVCDLPGHPDIAW